MACLLIRHKVENFEAWKPVYDNHRQVRQAAGLTDLHLWRNADDPNEVVVLFQVANPTRARQFAMSPDLQKAMHAAGVLGTPDIVLLNEC